MLCEEGEKMNNIAEVVLLLPFFLLGFYLINNSIKLRFNGEIQRFEGTVIDIIVETRRSISRTSKTRYMVVEYFNGYNYITYESSALSGFSVKRIGDKVTIIKNKKTGQIKEQGEIYSNLFAGFICIVPPLSIIIKSFF